MSQNRTEWVIHVWGKMRDTLELNDVEKFHIDMLKKFQSQQKRFDKILINIALDDNNDINLFNFLKEKLGEVFIYDNVEFLHCQNNPKQNEYVTFRPYVFDRIGEDVNIFYSHFKGYGTNVQVLKESYPSRVTDLCEMFWSYIMYQYSMNIDDVTEKLKDKCTYGWFLLNNENNDVNTDFYVLYKKQIQSGDADLKYISEGGVNKYYPGSFVWYNLKNIGEELRNKKIVTSITTDYLVKHSDFNDLCVHFCEVYLMIFLNIDSCYSVNDFNKELIDMGGTMYTQLYPSKKIGREYLKDFEKYLIENNII